MRMGILVIVFGLFANVARADALIVPEAALSPPVVALEQRDLESERFRARLLLGLQGMALVPISAVAGWAVGDGLNRGFSFLRGESQVGGFPFAMSVTAAGLSFLPLLWLTAPKRAPDGLEGWWLAALHIPAAALTVALSVIVWTIPAWSIATLVLGSVLTGVVDAAVLGSALRFDEAPVRPEARVRD